VLDKNERKSDQNQNVMNFKSFIPALEWLPKYSNKDLKGDLSAGLTVGVMLIPQGMAYSMLAGLPPIYGLYASIVPLILYAILGTSRQLAVGPVAMVALLVASGVGAIAEPGSPEFISLAILLALMVGIFQLMLGVLRLGFLVNFLSHPVVSGFTSAAALIIGFSQLKHLLGIDLHRSHHVHDIILQAVERIGETNVYTFIVGAIGIGLILALKRINKKFKINIPGPLVAVVFGIFAVWTMGLHEAGVKIVKEVPDGLPAPILPAFDWENLQTLLPIALTISLVGFMESIAVAKAIQAKHKNYKIVPNQELIGLGIANIGGAFFQAFPTTGGFSRTAVNDQAGARTGMASIISAVLIILTLLFLTPLFYYLPKAILASVIMVAVFGLIDYKEAIHLWKSDRRDFWMLIITFAATLTLGIEQGIGLGVVLSLILIIYQTTRPHLAVLGKIPGTNHYRNIKRFEDLEQRTDAIIVRFDAQLYFANTTFFKEKMEKLTEAAGPDLKVLILDAQSINSIDSSAMHALEEVVDELKEKEIDFYICDVKGPVRDALKRGHITEKIGEDNFFISVQNAVEYLDTKDHSHNHRSYVLQTNLDKV
jgi:SulP family sulfate permease